ncbi:MAG: aminopeptidase P N-terminal domain-containing protein, partial [Legionellales bacterium]
MFDYKARRNQVLDRLPVGSVVVIKGAKDIQRNRDNSYLFRQNSYFNYLTGFKQPGAYLVLTKLETQGYKSILYIDPYDKNKAQWTGNTSRLEDMPAKYGVTEALSTTDLDKNMPELLTKVKHFYFIHPHAESLPIELELNIEKNKWLEMRGSDAYDLVIHDLRAILDPMRLIKDEAEIQVLKEVSFISAQAHIALMNNCQAGMQENQLAALFEFVCKSNDCQDLAYPSIVAGGERGWCLHWPA